MNLKSSWKVAEKCYFETPGLEKWEKVSQKQAIPTFHRLSKPQQVLGRFCGMFYQDALMWHVPECLATCPSTYVTISVIVPYPTSSSRLPVQWKWQWGWSIHLPIQNFCSFAPILTVHYTQIRTGWHKYIIILARKGVSGSGGIDQCNGQHQSINQGTLLSTPKLISWSLKHIRRLR